MTPESGPETSGAPRNPEKASKGWRRFPLPSRGAPHPWAAALALLALLALVAALLLFHTEGPSYQGKSLGSWMRELNTPWPPGEDHEEPATRRAMFTNVVRAIGTNGLPFYLRCLEE